jgi:putative restriction endonuclease
MRTFGDVEGIAVGAHFSSRRDLASSGIHRPLQAGISGSEKAGADSIVLSGGYEDDEDHWSEIVYTGHGGNDSRTGKQIADQ